MIHISILSKQSSEEIIFYQIFLINVKIWNESFIVLKTLPFLFFFLVVFL